MQVVQALNNIKEAIRVFKGTADEHQALAQSFQVVAQAAMPEQEPVEEQDAESTDPE